MDATPALTLTVILVNAALRYIKRNIPTFDVDITAGIQLAAADGHIIPGDQVEIFTGLQGR